MGSGPLVISHTLVANNLTNPSASDAHGGMLDRLDSVTFAAPIFFHVVRFAFCLKLGLRAELALPYEPARSAWQNRGEAFDDGVMTWPRCKRDRCS